MPLRTKLSTRAVNAEVSALTALLDGGYLEIYAGLQPTSADDAILRQPRLATLRFGEPAFGPPTSGVVRAYPIAKEADAAATGTATWFRLYRRGHEPGRDEPDLRVLDGSVGTLGANLNLTSVEIQVHAEVSVDEFMLTASQV